MPSLRPAAVLAFVALASIVPAQKKPLDHSVYDGWKSLQGTVLSRDGKWVAYVIAPQEGDANGTIRSVADGHTISLSRASGIQFSRDGHFALATIVPPFAEARKARRDGVPDAEQPKNALAIVDLDLGKVTTVERVSGFTLPRDDSGWFAYRLEPPLPSAAPAKPEEKRPAADEDGQGRRRPGAAGARPAANTRGTTVVLRNLVTGKEERIEWVDASAWDRGGRTFAYSVAGDKDGKGSLVAVRNLAAGRTTTVVSGVDKAKYPRIAVTEDGRRVAFTTDKDDLKAAKPALSLYETAVESSKPELVALPNAGDSVNAGGALSYTPSGRRLIFATSKRPVADPPAVPDDEKVSVDIWTWKDPKIMPEQLVEAAAERARGYQALYDLRSRKSVQIETPDIPSVQLGDRGDGEYGFASVSAPYAIEATYDLGYADVYAVELRTGHARKILTHNTGTASLSPDGRTAAVYLGEKKEWVAYDLSGGGPVSLSGQIPFPVYDEQTDVPDVPSSYGLGGWTADGRVVVRDHYDLWLCDPKGGMPPEILTHGRPSAIRFTPVNLNANPDVRTVDVGNLPLTAVEERTKRGGLYWRHGSSVDKIVLEDRAFAYVAKAADADTLVYTRQDVTEYPDAWLTNVRFEHPSKITDTNPQQKAYNWLRSELVTWTSADGTPLQGILYKPEDFDYGKKYPMISYFYERRSDTLHTYLAPSPSASSINIPLFVSQGYLVFVPDVVYKTGSPGQSALSAIVSGVNSIVSRGYVDPKRLGIQGQSWGGYQVAYLVTVTDMFACAEAGAPVADMFSAYGGIRYGTGLLRQFQYEHEQSRIGGTPWDSFLKYVENSPVFHVDNVHTPLMIMSNDKDGSVPHTQGIELYSAMRRLGKPCWMVVYNDEDHNLVQRKNRKDISIRLSQYFDHFLKGAPMPVWMANGVPATEKGRTMGTELVPSPAPGAKVPTP